MSPPAEAAASAGASGVAGSSSLPRSLSTTALIQGREGGRGSRAGKAATPSLSTAARAQTPSLAWCQRGWRHGWRQSRNRWWRPVADAFFYFFQKMFAECFWGTRQSLRRVPDEKHSANTTFADKPVAECNTRQTVCRVFWGPPVFGSENSISSPRICHDCHLDPELNIERHLFRITSFLELGD